MSLSKQNPSPSKEFPVDTIQKTIGDLPPEMLTVLLEHLVDGDRKDSLTCRLVSLQWKHIIDSLLEKKFVSGQRLPFPELALVNPVEGETYPKLPYIRSHLTMFQDIANPLPFNGLVIDGFLPPPEPPNPEEIHVSLPHFVSTAGGHNLTSLTIKNQYIELNILVTTLSSTPSLKILRLSNSIVPTDIRTLPPILQPSPRLPNLTILQLESGRIVSKEMKTKSKLFFTWLVISYADQLVKLVLKTEYQFPALQQKHSYTISVGSKTFSIGTTSEAAFGNLKDLRVTHPGRKFLELSKTPALQSFVYINLFRDARRPPDFQGVTLFIDKCRATLQKLGLDAEWSELLSEAGLLDIDSPEFLPTAKITLPKLKIVVMKYPGLSDSKVWKKNFLVKCPALEELQVLDFHPDRDCYHSVKVQMDEDTDETEDEEDAEIVRQMVAERIRRTAERVQLYQDLEALHPGRKMEEVVAQYWVEEYGLWDVCKELKNVYVRFARDQDWYVVRKPEASLP